jgi:hypothetical protein
VFTRCGIHPDPAQSLSQDEEVPVTVNTPGVSTMAAFSAAVLIGGGNFVAVRFSNRELEPFWGAGLRFSLAAVLFVTIAVVLRLRPPRGRELALTATYGIFSFTLTYALMYWALVRITAGSTAVVLAAVPLVAPSWRRSSGSSRSGRGRSSVRSSPSEASYGCRPDRKG